ncbi:MAG: glycosyltransferase family 2 protein [Candidatus Sungbacteria bacterium]|nr:glycosyltransferase family 2 protein [bacterium]MDZ4260259.1 glycosyltransferase family 2 protein [Candidatus Sungbacteria bacterium]
MTRFFELLPGILTWGTLIAIVVFSWFTPTGVAIFIILFDTYWFLKTVYFSLHLRASFREMRGRMKKNWLEELHTLSQRVGSLPFAWQDVYHLVILPMYDEPYEIVAASFQSLVQANYPKEKLIVVLATEERVASAQAVAKRIVQDFGSVFFQLLITVHPNGLVNEIPGKGSNEAWAGKEAKKFIDSSDIAYERIIVSALDADTSVFPEYFGVLTHSFLTCRNPQRSSFQPIPLFINNIFTAPALARVISFSSSFWHLIQQSRPERLTTFSSHAMPFKPLVEVGFWDRDVVSEDSHIFWQCYLHYHGDWRVEPIFYPVGMDANVAPSFWGTMRNIYKQQRRWGWGCENIPYLLSGFLKDPLIPLRKKIYWAFHYIEGFHSWATNAIIIFSLGWLPIVLGGSLFRVSLLSFNLPRITRTIMTMAMAGIVSSAILSIILLPPTPVWFKRRHYVLYVVQWLLTPFTLIFFGAFPALESQTRLMLGGRWRLGFWVTPKYRP